MNSGIDKMVAKEALKENLGLWRWIIPDKVLDKCLNAILKKIQFDELFTFFYRSMYEDIYGLQSNLSKKNDDGEA